MLNFDPYCEPILPPGTMIYTHLNQHYAKKLSIYI